MRIESPTTDEQFAAYFDLRWRVLRAPWDQPRGSEQDELESVAHHAVAYDVNDRLVGGGRLHFNSDTEAQIRYMAVDPDHRGQGTGCAIVERLLKVATTQGAKQVVLNARHDVVGFYEKFGFREVGEGPTIFGDVKHVRMEKTLGSGS